MGQPASDFSTDAIADFAGLLLGYRGIYKQQMSLKTPSDALRIVR